MLAGALLVPPPAPAADTVLAREQKPMRVDGYGGRLVWDSWSPSRRAYRLRTRTGGVTSFVPVAPSPRPFDADVGPDGHGSTSVVFTRCRRPRRLTGCDVFRFDFATGRERRVPGAASHRAEEGQPSVWGSRVAFVRRFPRREGLAGQLPHLAVADRGRVHAVPGGTRGTFEDLGDEVFSGGQGPIGLDLRGRTLAFAWEYERPTCRTPRMIEPATEIWVVRLGASRRRVAAACSPDDGYLTSPSFSGRKLLYVHGDRDLTLRRRDLPSGAVDEAPLAGLPVFQGYAVDSDRAVLGRGKEVVARRLDFRAAPG